MNTGFTFTGDRIPTPEPEVEAYRKNADALITAWTEQLRDAVGKIERLADAMRAAIGAPDFDTAKNLLRTVVEKEVPKPSPAPRFGGEPGTQVPEVNPEDLKTVWEAFRQMGPGCQIDTIIFERLCKPGTDVQAVCYRAQMMSLVAMLIQTQQLAPNKDGTLDMKVFKIAATMPLEWMGEGVREGLPFDVDFGPWR